MPQEEAVQAAETQEPAVGGTAAAQQEPAPAAADIKPASTLPMSEYVKLRRDPAKTLAPESATGNTQETEEQKAAKEAEKQAEADKSKGGGWQRKIDKQTKKITQLTEALEAEKLARSTAEARLAGRPAGTEPPKEAAKESGLRARPKSTDLKDGKPKYASWEEYEDDLLAWNTEKYELSRKESESKNSQQTEREQIFQAHHERVEAYRKTQADYNDVMEEMDGEPLKAAAGLAIVEMEDGPQILYHLATHPEVREKINGMKSDFQVIAELGRISASLAKAQAPKSPKPQAPPPPAPIEPVGGGQAKSAKPIHELPIREYAKKRGITLRG